jgi:hypothetical protein
MTAAPPENEHATGVAAVKFRFQCVGPHFGNVLIPLGHEIPGKGTKDHTLPDRQYDASYGIASKSRAPSYLKIRNSGANPRPRGG